MKILLSNDDGFLAPGLHALADCLKEIAEITIVAPDRNRSGVSNSLTLDRPLSVVAHGNNYFSVNGTPTDCVHVAITGLLEELPDIVISGINEGANLSDDVIYSGTVAAAIEGRFLGLPSIAVSLSGESCQHYETAARVVRNMVSSFDDHPLSPETILNINVPDIPLADVRGVQVTKLGTRHIAQPVLKGRDPRGRDVFWIGLPGEANDAREGTDFYAVDHHFVSVTPLQLDLTHYQATASVQSWADACQACLLQD